MSNYNTNYSQVSTSGYQRFSAGAGLLSNVYNSPCKPEKTGAITYWIEGHKLNVAKPRPIGVKTIKDYPSNKKPIKEFSRKSRHKLFERLCEVNKNELPKFITLTYPSKFPSLRVAKKQMYVLAKRLKRRYPGLGLWWKCEFQARSAPHFHILAWGLTDFDQVLCQYIASEWYQIAGGGDYNHYLWHAGKLKDNKPCIQQVNSWRGVMAYASKYLGKVIKLVDDDSPGRFWGCMFRESIPWSRIIRIALNYRECARVMRIIKRYARLKSRNYKSLMGFVNDMDYWYKNLEKFCYY